MIRYSIAVLALAIAACGEEPEAEAVVLPEPVPTVAATPSLSPPTQDTFAAAFAEACPEAKPVNTSLCKSRGMGSNMFVCEYGLGEDEYLRHEADLEPQDGEWVIADPEAVCEQG